MTRNTTSRSSWIVLTLLVVAAGLAAAGGAERQEPPDGGAAAAPPAAAASQPGDAPSTTEADLPGSAGVRVYLDPETGLLRTRPTDEPDEPEIPGDRPGPGHWLNTYSADLVEEALPQGGYMVDLRGRFQSAVVATLDADGDAAEIDCRIGPVPEDDDER